MKKVILSILIVLLLLLFLIGCSTSPALKNEWEKEYKFTVSEIEDTNYFEIHWTNVNKIPIVVIENNKGIEQEFVQRNIEGHLEIVFHPEETGDYKLKVYGDDLGVLKIKDNTEKHKKYKDAAQSLTAETIAELSRRYNSIIGGSEEKTIDSKINDVETFKLSDLTVGNNSDFHFNLNVDDIDKKYVILFEADSYYVSSLSLNFNVSTFNGERVNIECNKYSTNIFSNYKNDENMDLNQTFIFSGFREVGDYVLKFWGNYNSPNRITVKTFWYK